MKEHNRATLERAIRQLPQYAPGEETWRRIAAELEKYELEAPLHSALRELPGYAPPAAVWDNIAATLDQPAARRRPGIILRYAAAASVAVLLAAVAWQFSGKDEAPAIEIVYSEEWVDEEALENDWEQDDATFRQIEALLSNDPLLRENPDYHTLRRELQELDDAKTGIEEMMKTYGQDPELVREMGKLERARTDLLQEMVAMI